MTDRTITKLMGPARFLTFHFQGYFMCRLATDPDPTNETRGMSGYTMALVREDELDQVIRLQPARSILNYPQADRAFIEKNLRRPALDTPWWRKRVEDGVRVTQVTFDGKPWPYQDAFVDAEVVLLGRDEPFDGPTFESRNNITGSDDTMAFVLDPFRLRIEKDNYRIDAIDVLNPAEPEEKIWQILDPSLYRRRLSSGFTSDDEEVKAAINVFDLYGYFRARRTWLRQQMAATEADETRRVEYEEFKSRLYQLEFWGDRVISKLSSRTNWHFEVNYERRIQVRESSGGGWTEGQLPGGMADTGQAWPFTLWAGGWDGDLLTGYMSGALQIPFEPTPTEP